MTVPLILKWEESEFKEIIFCEIYIPWYICILRNVLNTGYSKTNSTKLDITYGVIFINWIKSSTIYSLPALKVCNE